MNLDMRTFEIVAVVPGDQEWLAHKAEWDARIAAGAEEIPETDLDYFGDFGPCDEGKDVAIDEAALRNADSDCFVDRVVDLSKLPPGTTHLRIRGFL